MRFQVSSARSAAKDLRRDLDRSKADSADRDAVAPLSSFVSLRRSNRQAGDCRSGARCPLTRPTSSMIPVNMETSARMINAIHLASRRYSPYGSRKYPSTAKSSPKRCSLIDFTYAASLICGETGAGGKRHRTRAGQNLGRIVEENFVDDARSQRRPVDHGSAFDQTGW